MSNPTAILKILFVITLVISVTACDGGTASNAPNLTTTSSGRVLPQLSATEALGQKIFNDKNLSEPSGMSCATCHAANRAFTGPDNATVAPGIVAGKFGFRNVPAAAYAMFSPVFTLGADGPVGGQFYDGRAADLAEQAKGPFLNPNEMANTDAQMVINKIRSSVYVNEFTRIWGADIFNDTQRAYERVAASIAAFEKSALFQRFDSKYDFYLAGRLSLTAQEQRGLALFNDPGKGNCAACHPSTAGADGSPPLFTDFSYDNLGVPRNSTIPANLNPAFFDLGLGGPNRTDISDTTLYGKFKVPTLRNIALTAPYMHNGVFQTLREVVNFYATRDTDPWSWYPLNQKFNDLPAQYQINVNRTEVPMNRNQGDVPALTPQDIDDIVAFLNTLTDGFNLVTGTTQ
jgi:cytochrome c peroxidase